VLNFISVFLGGLVGTAARFGVDALLPHGNSEVSWSTIIVNILGSFALGLLTGTLWTKASTPSWLKAGLGAGVLGSFTTFSAVALGTAMAAMSGHVEVALINVGFSLVLGLIAAVLGILCGTTFFNRPRRGPVISDEGVDL
jgi:CrcB protein